MDQFFLNLQAPFGLFRFLEALPALFSDGMLEEISLLIQAAPQSILFLWDDISFLLTHHPFAHPISEELPH